MGEEAAGGGASRSLTDHLLLLSDSQSQESVNTNNPFTTPQNDPPPMIVDGTSKTNLSSGSPAAPRLKAYPPGSSGPYVVFFRPKGKRLNTNQICKDLTKRFSSVVSIDMVGTSKLRVTVSDRKQANEIASYQLFTLEYNVYLPAAQIEVAGVVTEASMTCEEIKQGCGRFKNLSLPPVEILECKQMYSVSQEGEKKVYSHSDSFCVTFSGTALPDYVVIGKLRLPVRLYVPKVMNCTNCKQLGHTAQYCCNKPRCARCGEKHVDGTCQNDPKCVYCNNAGPPHALEACPTYIQRREHQKRSLQQRSRRSYAEMVKKTAPPPPPPVETTNIYTFLSLDDQDSDSEVSDGVPFVFKGSSRKRVRLQRPSKTSQNLPSNDLQPTMNTSKAGGSVTKCSTPEVSLQDARNFPPLQGTSQAPGFKKYQPERERSKKQEEPQGVPMFTLSGIVDVILNFFNASDPVKTLVKGFLPVVTPFLKQLSSKMPLLATIISFDG